MQMSDPLAVVCLSVYLFELLCYALGEDQSSIRSNKRMIVEIVACAMVSWSLIIYTKIFHGHEKYKLL